MKLKFDEYVLNKPLKDDERIVEHAQFIALYRNWFKEEHIEHFLEYWVWCHNNGINSKDRHASEGAHPLEKKDKALGMDKGYYGDEKIHSELQLTHEFNDFFKYMNNEIIRQYSFEYPDVGHPVAHEGKIQNTQPSEGYHVWHSEWNYEVPRRQLAYALFLNDVDEGGELEFLHQSIRIKPRKGDMVVWPAFWSHLHRGNPPLSGEKWIVTGWFEQLGVHNDITFEE